MENQTFSCTGEAKLHLVLNPFDAIKDGSVVITRCRHPSAVYVIRVNDTERGRIVIVNPQKNLDMFVGSLIALK